MPFSFFLSNVLSIYPSVRDDQGGKLGWASPFCGKVGVALAQGGPLVHWPPEKGSWPVYFRDTIVLCRPNLPSEEMCGGLDGFKRRRKNSNIFLQRYIYLMVETFHPLFCPYWGHFLEMFVHLKANLTELRYLIKM